MLFYFSATGNTKKVANTIAARIGEIAYDIESLLHDEKFDFELRDSERLGFFAPVYFGSVPEIMVQFIEKLHVKTAENYYGYIVMTYGNIACAAPQKFVATLLKHGISTNAIFGVASVDTFLPMYDIPDGEARTQVDEQAQTQTDFIAEQITDRTPITHIQTGQFPRLTSFALSPLYAVMRKTANFHASESCIGCGKCEKNCPVKAIDLDEMTKRPHWGSKRCLLCLRCVHHCPVDAIDYRTMTKGKLRFKI